jgi:hypothetical protein
MSLFTDSDHVTQSDMAAVDPEIPDIVSAEGFSADVVDTIIQQSWDECAGIIGEVTRPYYETYPDPVIAWHTYGRFSPLQLSRIVVTSEYVTRQSPIQRWMLRMALEKFYESVANRRESDRYANKLLLAQGHTKSAWRALVAYGLPTVASPLVCPGATHELGAGVFSASNISSMSGGTNEQADYEVAISWVNGLVYQSPQIPVNAESGPSVSVPFTVPADSRLVVSIAGLNAPGSLTIPRPITEFYFGQVATGWNIYVGLAGQTKYLQNSSPLPLSQTSYSFSAAPVLSGSRLWSGQVADSKQVIQRIAGRG